MSITELGLWKNSESRQAGSKKSHERGRFRLDPFRFAHHALFIALGTLFLAGNLIIENGRRINQPFTDQSVPNGSFGRVNPEISGQAVDDITANIELYLRRKDTVNGSILSAEYPFYCPGANGWMVRYNDNVPTQGIGALESSGKGEDANLKFYINPQEREDGIYNVGGDVICTRDGQPVSKQPFDVDINLRTN